MNEDASYFVVGKEESEISSSNVDEIEINFQSWYEKMAMAVPEADKRFAFMRCSF
jgi:hypothetical protein